MHIHVYPWIAVFINSVIFFMKFTDAILLQFKKIDINQTVNISTIKLKWRHTTGIKLAGFVYYLDSDYHFYLKFAGPAYV